MYEVRYYDIYQMKQIFYFIQTTFSSITYSQSSFMDFYEIVTAYLKLNEEKQRWDKGNDETSILLNFKITDRTF